MFRFGVSTILAALVAACPGMTLAAPQPVVLVEVPGATPGMREKMRVAAEDGLESLGATVSRQLHDPQIEECTTAPCMAERAKRFGATHVLEIQGNYSNESYKLRLDVRATKGDRVVGSESKECEICSGRDFLRAIKERTTILWTRVTREQASVAGPSGESGDNVPTTAIPLTKSERRPPRSLWRQPLPLLGLGLMLGGVVSMGFGGYYLAVDGEPDPSCPNSNDCIYVRDTKRRGWMLLAGGGGALLAGTALVIFGRDSDTSPKVALGPDRILVFGRF